MYGRIWDQSKMQAKISHFLLDFLPFLSHLYWKKVFLGFFLSFLFFFFLKKKTISDNSIFKLFKNKPEIDIVISVFMFC